MRSRHDGLGAEFPAISREIHSYIKSQDVCSTLAVRRALMGRRNTTREAQSDLRRIEWDMRNPVLDLPLSAVMRSEIALPLQQVLKVYTVGSFLSAWRSPKRQRDIERLFDTPQQARHAATICAAWLGFETPPTVPVAVDLGWWRKDEKVQPALA